MHRRTFDWTNDTGEPAELVCEPDGMPIEIPAGASLQLICSGTEDGNLEIDQRDRQLVAFGWPSSRAEVFIDRELVYRSPVAMPALPPRTTTKEFIRGMFGRAADPATEDPG